jgi:hypothetical protein
MARKEFIDKFLDPRRSIDDECGYPKTGAISPHDYKELYDRSEVACRVVQVMPQECWQVQPSIYEDEDPKNITEFEKAWVDLPRNLRVKSWYQDEQGNAVWEHLLRADILSGIGSFGVLLLGLDDGGDLHEPVRKGRKSRLLYLRAFDESLIQITRYEVDKTNPRYGRPVEYAITLNDISEQSQGGIGLQLTTTHVHWSRIIHLADNLGSSEIFGAPRLRPVLNRVMDLVKLYGGSAEMYWRGAFPGLSIETHPQLGGEVDIDRKAIRGEMEQYMNGLQRYLAMIGVSTKSLAPQVVDPTPQIEAQLTAIAIQLGIPKRIFMGTERGKLASTQDDSTWNDRLRFRQGAYITPKIIVPFVDRLIELGVLPEPKGYSVQWPDLNALTEEQKAAIALRRTLTMARYATGGTDAVMAPRDFLMRIMGFTETEASAIVESVKAEQKKLADSPARKDGDEASQNGGQGRKLDEAIGGDLSQISPTGPSLD